MMKRILWLGIIAVFLMFNCFALNTSEAEKSEENKINIFNAEKGQFKKVSKIIIDKDKLRNKLTKEQYHVTQEQGTEAPHTGTLLKNKKTGVYQCVVCKTDLFASDAKYDSGTGWPSFYKPIADGNVETKEDNSLFMRRVEVVCPVCGSHLGHVFDDGPAPTYKRFCINSASLTFEAMEKNAESQ